MRRRHLQTCFVAFSRLGIQLTDLRPILTGLLGNLRPTMIRGLMTDEEWAIFAAVEQPFYFVADAYYTAHKIVAGLLQQNNHVITRMKSNAVAYTAYQQRGPRKRSRPRVYGSKIKLSSLLQASSDFQPAPSPVYGENKVIIQYRVRDLLWRPAGRLVRFVAVIHPARGACLLMCTDTSLDAIDIIRSLRPALQDRAHLQAGSAPDRFLHLPFLDVQHEAAAPQQRQSASPSCLARVPGTDVKRRSCAYHVFVQAGIICQGLLQYLAVAHPQRLVWNSFGSWLRTIRPGIPPSELVVAIALRQSLPEFLLNTPQSSIFAKFVTERQDSNKKCRPYASPPDTQIPRKPRTREY